ncbi:PEGA domain-containing protein [Thermococcus sp.]|uniref:PEGA domain-containing protein n=1 Tax=Thermococcus sp. TaxID=35749 RepID=UPI002637CA9A|nr:PEGA domain-containing protein [Thermococcus sp.]
MDEARAVAIAKNGDIVVAGFTNTSGAGKWDVLVLRLDGEGNLKWAKTYGGKHLDWAEGVSIAGNGDIIVVGVTYSFGAGMSDAWVLRLDADGNVKWQKAYGGRKDDEAHAVTIAPNGDIIIAGHYGAADWTGIAADLWVLRVDSNGDVKWAKTFEGKYYSMDKAYGVALAQNGNIVVVGTTRGFGIGAPNYLNFWVLNLPPEGNLQGCNIYQNSKVTAKASNAVVGMPQVRVEVSEAQAGNSNVVVKETSAKPSTQCNAKTTEASTLKILSKPPEAKVYINNTYYGTTPLTLNLTARTYEVKLTLSDYMEYTTVITLKPGEEKTLNVSLTPAFGYLTLTSDPEGAAVFIDGKQAGTTPLEKHKLPAGQHQIVVKKHRYTEENFTITIEPGKEVVKTITLAPSQTSTTTSITPTNTTTPSQSETTTTSRKGKETCGPGLVVGFSLLALVIKRR